MFEYENFAKILAEGIILSTYEVSDFDSFLYFLKECIYQDVLGAIYLYRVVEPIQCRWIKKEYTDIYLKNIYIKTMDFLGFSCCIQMVWGEISKYSSIYYNQVIKPALIRLTGLWLSGDIETSRKYHCSNSLFVPYFLYFRMRKISGD